uniref:Osteocrin n=1 Tax=Poecilia reticulata TaxID=8081 RepID=A0A3P9NN55_POERE
FLFSTLACVSIWLALASTCWHSALALAEALAVLWRRTGRMKPRLELSAKLLRTDDLMMMMENDVTEPQRKRSFPGNNAPLDRLSVGSMETRQGKKNKVAESPRRRSNPPPIDRVGMSRLPTTRG